MPWKPAPAPLDEAAPVAEADEDPMVVRERVGCAMVVLRGMDMPVPAEMVPVMAMVALGEADMLVIMDEDIIELELELG